MHSKTSLCDIQPYLTLTMQFQSTGQLTDQSKISIHDIKNINYVTYKFLISKECQQRYPFAHIPILKIPTQATLTNNLGNNNMIETHNSRCIVWNQHWIKCPKTLRDKIEKRSKGLPFGTKPRTRRPGWWGALCRQVQLDSSNFLVQARICSNAQNPRNQQPQLESKIRLQE